MGLTFRPTICRSIISFKRTWGNSEEDLPYFRGTISCRPCNDTSSQTLSDWERLDDDTEGSLGETDNW